jgi:hypothetical protein
MRIGMHVGCCVEKRDQVTATHPSPASTFAVLASKSSSSTRTYALSTLRISLDLQRDIAIPERVATDSPSLHLMFFRNRIVLSSRGPRGRLGGHESVICSTNSNQVLYLLDCNPYFASVSCLLLSPRSFWLRTWRGEVNRVVRLALRCHHSCRHRRRLSMDRPRCRWRSGQRRRAGAARWCSASRPCSSHEAWSP